jgi:hypothetical protein
MVRTLQQARARAAEVASRAISAQARDAKGRNGATEASSNEEGQWEEPSIAPRDGRLVEHTDEANVEAETSAEGAAASTDAQTRGEHTAAPGMHEDTGRRTETGHEGAHRMANEDDSFYTARETMATGATTLRG